MCNISGLGHAARPKLTANDEAIYTGVCIVSCRNQQECQKIFKATEAIDKAVITQKLMGFGVGSIENIDPNPDNYVSAAIIHTRTQQIGCLLRLEPNNKAEVISELSYLCQYLTLVCLSNHIH